MKSLKIAFAITLVFFTTIKNLGAEDKTISTVLYPGIGTGNIKIGFTPAQVNEQMGKRKIDGKTVTGEEIKVGDKVEYWLNYIDNGIRFIFDKGKRLERIEVFKPDYVISETNIGVNNSITFLDRLYGKGETKKIDVKHDERIYYEKGISFVINRETERIKIVIIHPISRKFIDNNYYVIVEKHKKYYDAFNEAEEINKKGSKDFKAEIYSPYLFEGISKYSVVIGAFESEDYAIKRKKEFQDLWKNSKFKKIEIWSPQQK